jgi:beta-glucanase (GH16 family)
MRSDDRAAGGPLGEWTRPMIAPRKTDWVGAVAVAMVGAAILGVTSLPDAAGGATPPATTTTTVVKRVPSSGTYSVVVTVPAPRAQESVSVSVGSQAQNDVSLGPGEPAALAFELHLRHRRSFIVSVASSAGAVHVKIGAALQASAPPTPAGVGGTTGAGGSTGAAGATGTTGTVAPLVAPANGPYKHLVWSDEFAGAAGSAPNPANWSEDTYGSCGPGTLSKSTQSTANASLNGDGQLGITADGPPGYQSAQLDSGGHLSLEYGELEARIKLPSGSGLCTGFWMTGDGPAGCWPECGEIDIMEAISPTPDVAYATLHGPVLGSGNYQQWQQTLTSATPLDSAFHTYGLIWTPGRITWTFDGVPYASATPSELPASAKWVFSAHAFHVLLSLAVGGWPGPPTSAAAFPTTMYVDWVRLYD